MSPYPSRSPNPPATSTNPHLPKNGIPLFSTSAHRSVPTSKASPRGTSGRHPSSGFSPLRDWDRRVRALAMYPASPPVG